MEPYLLKTNLILVEKLLKIFEPIVIVLGSLVASAIRFNDFSLALLHYPIFPKVVVLPLLWLVVLARNNVWDKSSFFNSNEFYARILRSSWEVLVGFAAFTFIFEYPISRFWVVLNMLLILVGLLALRFMLRLIYLNDDSFYRELIYLYVGDSNTSEKSIEDFVAAFGFKPKLFFLDKPKSKKYDTWLKAYYNKIETHNIYGVIIGVGEIQDSSLLRKLVDTRRDLVIDFVLATRIGAIVNRFERLEAPSIVRIRESSLVSGGSVIKRLFDFVFALCFLVLLSPLFLIVSILVKLSSEGPVLFIDRRVGLSGKIFSMPKFRSMYKNAEFQRATILGNPDEKMLERYKSDPRITPFGRFIRRWSIDELPQFWCVLIGTMSVVGPRPVLHEELTHISREYELRFIAKPGLTGLWQVTGRKEVPWNERMIRDIAYIDNWSFSYDLVLIFKTIGAIVKGQGAH